MTTTIAVEKATIEDIRKLAKKIPQPNSLMQLFDGERRACEAEWMVWQTLHACILNHKEHGEAFSIRDIRSGGGTGLVDNFTAYGMLVDRKYFIEEKRGDKTVIIMTQKLVDVLRGHLARKSS